jgi:hypothetical protein
MQILWQEIIKVQDLHVIIMSCIQQESEEEEEV